MQEKIHPLLQDLLHGELTETGRQALLELLETQAGIDAFAAMLDQQLASKTFTLTGELPETARRFLSSVLEKTGIRGIRQVDAAITNRTQRMEATAPADQLPPVHRVHFMRRWGWAAAAAIVLATGIYFFNTDKQPDQVVQTKPQPIAPGKTGAILTLANGSQLVLDSMGNGVVAEQNGSQAILKNGQLSYETQGNNTGAIAYNTMSTPRGRQFHVTLPDGTDVWLNAASSIKYPTIFSGNSRQVYITGEAWFEVAKNEKMPFRVDVNNKETIEVLGTQFNVSAYDNDATINTTLISGAVRIASTILKPGQQVQISNKAIPANTRQQEPRVKLINNADLDKILAWKKGIFNFEGVSLEEVMKQLERWYDIEVVYEKGIPDIKFGGKMSKDMDLNGLLMALEKSEVRFRLEGKKLIVTK